MRRGLAIAVTLLAAVAVGLGLARGRAEPPLVVLIVLDTVRADVLPPWGADEAAAPWIASLAKRSVVFRNGFSSSSWTAPATATVFTGLYPPQHGVVRGFIAQHRGDEEDPGAVHLTGLPLELRTLPERLRDVGWRTLGLANNVNIGSELGFDRGFDAFVGNRDLGGDWLAAQLELWLAGRRSRPTFVYLHLNDAHHPYLPRSPWYVPEDDPEADRFARYRSEVRFVDHVLADLAGDLGWDDATVLLVTDHGEAFGEHDDHGHGMSLFSELNRVAILLRAPGRVPEGAVVDENVSLVDVLPTVLELAGVPVADGPGRSLVPLANGRAVGFEDRVLFAHRAGAHRPGELWVAVRGRWKLHAAHRSFPAALYDLVADPGETMDQAAAEPAVLAELAAELEAFRGAEARSGPAVGVELDEALYRHLEELGYVQ